ncbi:RNA polymerase ECF-type sigma factor [Alteromonas sp. KUL49]|nr:RNA polymerase ECF-type sigma factor [Alteromonas sp. KUL49]
MMKDAILSATVSSRSLRSYIRKLVSRESDVEDVLHDTYLKMADAQQTIEEPTHYAHRVAKNIVHDMHRQQFRQHELLDEEPACDKSELDNVIEHSQRIELYQRIVARMPKVRREVFIRYRVQGQTKADIAKNLGLSTDSVDKHITRALTTLKGEMALLINEKEGK